MSSPISRPLAESVEALLAAATEVAETCLFAYVEPSDAAAFEVSVGDGTGWLWASVRFTGPSHGALEITLPETLARRLCAAFAGAESPDEATDQDLVDFTGELANMVCGAWLTRANNREAFDLTPPRVVRNRPTLDRPVAANASTLICYYAIDEAPVRLAAAWGPASAATQGDTIGVG